MATRWQGRSGDYVAGLIAGTRPQGASCEADEALADELAHDPKELAQHMMLLDLGRIDVGRVAQTAPFR